MPSGGYIFIWWHSSASRSSSGGDLAAAHLFLPQATGGAATYWPVGWPPCWSGCRSSGLHWTVAQRDAARTDEGSAAASGRCFCTAFAWPFGCGGPEPDRAAQRGLLATLFGAPRPGADRTEPAVERSRRGTGGQCHRLGVLRGRSCGATGKGSFSPEPDRSPPALTATCGCSYTLRLTVLGVQYVLRSIFFDPQVVSDLNTTWLAGGISLALVGAPLWARTWLVIDRAVGRTKASAVRCSA